MTQFNISKLKIFNYIVFVRIDWIKKKNSMEFSSIWPREKANLLKYTYSRKINQLCSYTLYITVDDIIVYYL